MTFDNWLDTLIEEKGIDLEDYFYFDKDGEFNIMQYGTVVEAIKSTSKEEQNKIKHILVEIDFKNGNIEHFLKHLGQALA